MRIARRLVGFVVWVALICCATSAGHARMIATPTISDLFARADRVVAARIDTVLSHGDCGVRYEATLVQSFKGSFDAGQNEITFGRITELEPGVTYLLFLSYIADPWVLLERISAELRARAHFEDEFLEAALCHGLVPGYEYNPALVGIFQGDEFILPLTPGFIGMPADLPQPSTRVNVLEYTTERGAIMRYLQELGARR
jgi:hypothetical protein